MSRKIELTKNGLSEARGKRRQRQSKQLRGSSGPGRKARVLTGVTNKWQHELDDPRKWEFQWGPGSKNKAVAEAAPGRGGVETKKMKNSVKNGTNKQKRLKTATSSGDLEADRKQ